MKSKILWIIPFILIQFCVTVSAEEKIGTNKVETRLYDLEHKVKIIDNNQLNYKIEKDLLKETYSNNYKSINTFITFILGLFAILGYLGIRDIGTIKDKYEIELSNIKNLKSQFDLKSDEFNSDKKKIEDELRGLFSENQEQNKKIKFLELKDRMRVLYKENQLSTSLEFANAALEIDESDALCLNTKATILIRLNQFPEALNAFSKSLEHNPMHSTTQLNYAECLLFSGKIKEANNLINNNTEIFKEKGKEGLLGYFKILEFYYDSNLDKLKEIAKGYIQYDNLDEKIIKISGWDLGDAQYFAHFQKSGELKTTVQNIIWYLNGELAGRDLLTRLNIPLPTNTQ